jgi:protein TonB
MIRVTLSIVPAILFVFGLFWILQSMIQVATKPPAMHESLHLVGFVRLKREQPLVKKERLKPKKPLPKKEPPKPKIDIKKEIKIVQQPLMRADIDVDLPIDLSAVSALGDAYVSGFGTQEISTNVLPLSTIQPIYPKRAKIMKKEGFVKLEFTITEFGTVKAVEVVESDPPKLFDASAKSALLKWKFKPKIVANQTVEQRALIQIDYRLNR